MHKGGDFNTHITLGEAFKHPHTGFALVSVCSARQTYNTFKLNGVGITSSRLLDNLSAVAHM